MKTKIYPFYPILLLTLLLLFGRTSLAQQQGKVVINEYMPWTSNGCGVTSEFVELLNFGPGSVDIGCYILTTGVYSVTIPKNTILQPGQFYVIAGQSFIPGSCANVDSTATGVHADLNWNTCNCTNVAIPTTGDGMMTDGGSSNTPLVLLDPSLNIIDAVVRNTPTEATQTITTSSVAGGCTPKTFNIGSMNPTYEVLGMSAGRGNSFARTLDGDRNWLKDPQQSGHATNNRSGRTTDITYDFDMINPTSCDETGKGSVSIYVKHSNYTAVFPMSYTISQDLDNDGDFDFSDQYDTYYDNSPPFIEIDDLPVGHFKVTVASAKGCYLANFEFTIIPCNPSLLPVKLVYFKNKERSRQPQLEWLLQDVQNLQTMVLEKSSNGNDFAIERVMTNNDDRGIKLYSALADNSGQGYYRLRVVQKGGRSFYSPVVRLQAATDGIVVNRVWPNPADDKLNLELQSNAPARLPYTIFNSNGLTVTTGILQVSGTESKLSLSLPASMPAGVYQLQLASPGQPISLRFVKR